MIKNDKSRYYWFDRICRAGACPHLLGHKDVEIKWYGSRSYIDQAYASVFRICSSSCLTFVKEEDLEQLCEEVDVVFTATPQGLVLL